MNTLLLDRTTWDLLLDASGNIAVASGAYAIGQDISSAVRVFSGEAYYDTTRGLPYKAQILGRTNSTAVFQAQAEAAALTVPDCASAQCLVAGLTKARKLTGAILFTTDDGETSSVNI
ncbi:hypothetical protein [Acetobacter sp. UBA5411]|uniref:hypothetical protein n=1 Tax=Acetobacter sp. UBA5411 TaxID=1945905 RepID=UPI0025C55351|nr:hypothetical protein [Acetobacter sp. UBA5411]